jgi:hypothetical protein
MQAVNADRHRAPFGVGFHPYLTFGTTSIDGLHLTLPAMRYLATIGPGDRPTMVPVAGTPADFTESRPIGSTRLDTAYGGLVRSDGAAVARLADPERAQATELWVDGSYRYLMVYTADEVSAPQRRRTSVAIEPRRANVMRRISLTLVCLLLAAALWETAFLISDLIQGTGVANLPSHLLATGALVWAGNNLAFALLYWLLDGGGPPARIRRSRPVDFAFTQHINPELAPPGWRPQFLDYLHLSFTNSTALSPTDVMPLTHRAKYLMIVQSTVALALFGLVVARAVNAFT